MEGKRFLRTIEDFVCDNCGFFVSGNGFTNHCSKCLFSKHVDIHPGDRLEVCHGLMRPVEVIQDSNGWIVIHCCDRCGIRRRKLVESNDNFEALLEVAQKASKNY